MEPYLENPYAHTGVSFEKVDCAKITPKKVFICKGNTHTEIVKYFTSRCDFDMMPFNPSKIWKPYKT